MNKRAAKKARGFSIKKYKKLLREGSNQEIIVDEKGNKIIINPLKHILMNEAYKDDAKNKYLKEVLTSYKSFLKQVEEEEAAKKLNPSYEIVKEETNV